jgi:hypothetical protein
MIQWADYNKKRVNGGEYKIPPGKELNCTDRDWSSDFKYVTKLEYGYMDDGYISELDFKYCNRLYKVYRMVYAKNN